MTEQQIQTKIIHWLRANGYYVVKVMQASHSGVPDILCCKDGKFVAIEVKKKGGIVSELQKKNIEWIEQTGGIAFVAYSLDDVKERLCVV